MSWFTVAGRDATNEWLGRDDGNYASNGPAFASPIYRLVPTVAPTNKHERWPARARRCERPPGVDPRPTEIGSNGVRRHAAPLDGHEPEIFCAGRRPDDCHARALLRAGPVLARRYRNAVTADPQAGSSSTPPGTTISGASPKCSPRHFLHQGRTLKRRRVPPPATRCSNATSATRAMRRRRGSVRSSRKR